MDFESHIGIDYSGRATPVSRTAALQVYATSRGASPQPVSSPNSTQQARKNWCRREIAHWLIQQAQRCRFIAGIDHGFSFPRSYFQRYDIGSWPQFLDDFCQHWPADEAGSSIDSLRQKSGIKRTGKSTELRLTETWTSSAKSVFLFDVQGSVAKSTHAGIPWLRDIRRQTADRVHFWPFDGWQVPDDRSVIAEIYPSIFRKRYAREDRTTDQHDAYCVARWLATTDEMGFLDRYFRPGLTEEEMAIAQLEGWILGIL